jgi:hypothetical protein
LQAGDQPTAEADEAIDPRWAALLALRGDTEPEPSADDAKREGLHKKQKPVGTAKNFSKNPGKNVTSKNTKRK